MSNLKSMIIASAILAFFLCDVPLFFLMNSGNDPGIHAVQFANGRFYEDPNSNGFLAHCAVYGFAFFIGFVVFMFACAKSQMNAQRN